MDEIETNPPVMVTLPYDAQAVVVFMGDGFPVILEDTTGIVDLPDLFSHPVQRALAVARLRAWADLLA